MHDCLVASCCRLVRPTALLRLHVPLLLGLQARKRAGAHAPGFAGDDAMNRDAGRSAKAARTTRETSITASVTLNGSGRADVSSGIGFLDHMLEQLARHSLMDIELKAKGDLHVDGHHTTEDCGIVLGQAVNTALGDRRGIRRFGQAAAPMDESLTEICLDCSGRPHLTWKVSLPQTRVGGMESELFREWFRAFAEYAGLTVHVHNRYGGNAHHIVESCFKALALALRRAMTPDPRNRDAIPSTKGNL